MDAQPVLQHVYETHAEAEAAIRALVNSGVVPGRISLIGKGFTSEAHPVGFYTTGERVRTWGGMGALWGAVWGLLFAPGVFFLPGLGVVALAGPVVSALAGMLEGGVLIGGASALVAALTRLGVSGEDAIRYESSVRADQYVLLVHGTADELASAQAVLDGLAA